MVGMDPARSGAAICYALAQALRHPRQAIRHVYCGFRRKDRAYAASAAWVEGALPRLPLARLWPEAAAAGISIPRALDREWMISITVDELACLCAVEKCVRAKRVMEIGTWDGNTALALAANLEGGEGEVVTLDLPPDFGDNAARDALVFPDVDLNLTDRRHLGRQLRQHPLAGRVRQVYGDSAAIDWSRLGGPFDLIFIDGCHSEAYVDSDSRNALKHLRAGGAIVWHDYACLADVSRVVDRIARARPELKVAAIEGTRLALGVVPAAPGGPDAK